METSVQTKCIFMLPNKKRPCQQPLDKDSQKYCRFHQFADTQEEWITCPYEPKYSLPKSKLEEHLKKCPKFKEIQKIEGKSWNTSGINILHPELPSQILIQDIDFEVKDVLIEKIKDVYQQLKEKEKGSNLQSLFEVDEVMQVLEEENKESGLIVDSLKHSNQQNKIINIMRTHKLIKDDLDEPIMYIEYGAGRAGLSSFVANSLKEFKKKDLIQFLMVDKDTRRNKLDKEFKEEFKVYREKIDIADFDLLKFMKEKQIQNQNVIMIAKHLCGGATDLTLTSALKALEQNNNLKGIAIATCCHQVCSLNTYVNIEFLSQYFNQLEIQILIRLSSWSVSQKVKLNKRKTGLKAKRILDYGRCLFIEKSLGQSVFAFQYCNPFTESPENIMILSINS